jgi:hypothetical protein
MIELKQCVRNGSVHIPTVISILTIDLISFQIPKTPYFMSKLHDWVDMSGKEYNIFVQTII